MHTHLQGKFPLFGIAATAQSGKSTVAGFLKSRGYKEDSFAAPIRQFVATLLGTTVEGLEPIKEQVVPWIGKSPRQIMQTFGTDWGRSMVNPDLWIEACMQRIGRDPEGRYVLSDVRFENEAKIIRQNGGVILHLARPDGRRTVADHASEAGIERVSGVDFQIVNDGSLDDLQRKVDRLLYAIWQGKGLEEFVCQRRS